MMVSYSTCRCDEVEDSRGIGDASGFGPFEF